MILSKRPCPDCRGTGRDPRRGLCRFCHGEGKRRPTAIEEKAAAERSLKCPCGVVDGSCNGSCGCYLLKEVDP